MTIARSLVAIWFLFAAGAALAQAGTCRKSGEVCVEGPETRTIRSTPVYRDCWRTTSTFECVSPNTVDYCAPLKQVAGCSQTGTRCVQTAWNGDCLLWENTWHCGDSQGNPPNVIRLADSYTITEERIDEAPECATLKNNSSCTFAQRVCTDGPATRNINGLDVYRDCWAWSDNYTCVYDNAVNYCQPLISAGCAEQGTPVCTQFGWNNQCLAFERVFLCDAQAGPPLPTNVILLDTPYRIVSDTIGDGNCPQYRTNPNCRLTGSVCVEGPETRVIDGISVYKDCWLTTETWQCPSATNVDECAQMAANQDCSMMGESCREYGPDGVTCTLTERRYRCKTSDGNTSTVTNCSGQLYCLNGTCYDANQPPDTDFLQVITAAEISRQAGAYQDPNSGTFFRGEAEVCGNNGLADCCKAKPGASADYSNQAMAVRQGLNLGKEIADVGSYYVWDSLTRQGGGFLQQGVEAMVVAGSNTGVFDQAFNPSFSYMGFSVGMNATTTGIQLGSLSMGTQTFYFAFDPWSFAISLAIYFITQAMQCSEDEQALMLKKGAGLCHVVGSYRDGFLNSKRMTSHCCFNSKLAKIINIQGRAQVGPPLAGPKNPNCSGLTLAQLQSIDWSQIDFAEFIADVVPRAPDGTLLTNKNATRLQDKVTDYFNSCPRTHPQFPNC